MIRRALALLLLGLGALAPAAGAAPADTLPPGLTLALQDDVLPVVPETGIGGRIDLLASTGVRVTRVDVLWNTVAPRRPGNGADPADRAYRWSRYDTIVDGLTARGIAVILNVYRSPSWANGGRTHQWAPNPAPYAAFMTALARRYDGVTRDRAGRTHGPVAMFEAWNEPNLPGFLMPQWRTGSDGVSTPASPGIYASLLTRAHAAVKAVSPEAWVIGVSGGPSGSNNPPSGSVGIVTFVRALVPLAPPADAFAQHLYPAIGPADSVAMPSFTRLPELIGELDAVRPGLPILITEFGWTTQASPVRASHVSEAQQEVYLREAVDMLAAIPRVRLAVWFNTDDNSNWPAGLRRADGSPKPSWPTFGALAKFRLSGPPPPPPAPLAPLAAPAPPAPPEVPFVATAERPAAVVARCAALTREITTATTRMRVAQRARLRARADGPRRLAQRRLTNLAERRTSLRRARALSCAPPGG